NDEAATGRLREFLLATEGGFQPPLRERVDLDTYALKLLGEGHVFACVEEASGKLAAAVCVYCQPERFERAFIPFVATLVPGQGLGGRVLDAAVRYCREAGSRGIDTQTWDGNTPSLALFESRGF